MNPVTSDAIFTARVRADGTPYHLVVHQDGLTIGFRPGKGRMVAWSEIIRLAEGPPADRFGVVVNGRLLMTFEYEEEAHDKAADQRQIGLDAIVIRVPVSLTL